MLHCPINGRVYPFCGRGPFYLELSHRLVAGTAVRNPVASHKFLKNRRLIEEPKCSDGKRDEQQKSARFQLPSAHSCRLWWNIS